MRKPAFIFLWPLYSDIIFFIDHYRAGGIKLALLIAFLAHLSRRLIGELIVYRSSRRLCVLPFTLSNMNISATSWPIRMKFYPKHHWVGGKASVGFDPDWIRTLVSMATGSSHRVIMGKTVSSHFLECF